MEEKKLEQDLAEFLKNRFRNPKKIDDIEEYTEKLKSLHKEISKPNTFKAGDLVIWKKGLKNRARPAENEPCIVIEVLDTPIFDTEKESGTPYFHEPLNLSVGLLADDGDFLIFYFDQRRFELFKK